MSTQKIDTPVYVDMQVKSDLSTGVQLRYGNEAFIVIIRSQNVHKTIFCNVNNTASSKTGEIQY